MAEKVREITGDRIGQKTVRAISETSKGARIMQKQELERLIKSHEKALKLLMINPKLFAREIDKTEKDLAGLRAQLEHEV